jgi:hypothetical protein
MSSCYLATAVILSPVYTAVTWQWVYISLYETHKYAVWGKIKVSWILKHDGINNYHRALKQ